MATLIAIDQKQAMSSAGWIAQAAIQPPPCPMTLTETSSQRRMRGTL